jgi:hypothetical protein
MERELQLRCSVALHGPLEGGFRSRSGRPTVIFGAEAKDPFEITFLGAYISWPILYTTLARAGLTRDAFKDAVTRTNLAGASIDQIRV